jgi:hypothetical protein
MVWISYERKITRTHLSMRRDTNNKLFRVRAM